MSGWVWTLIIIVAVIVVIAAGVFWVRGARKRRRTESLRDRFGEQYDRKVEASGRRRAEDDLASAAERHDHLDLRPLNSASLGRYLERWKDVQAQFVDQPAHALSSAGAVVSELMRERGYPVDDFEAQADMVALDHPDVVDHYRAAHATQERTRTGLVGTEDARVAMLQYRALFEALIDRAHAQQHEHLRSP